MTTQTLGENSRIHCLLKDTALIILSSFFIGLCAPLVIPLPFSPVPLALQPHIVLFLATILGSRRGALAVLAFLFQGALGLPVFAGGCFGLLHLVGPRGGYLLGYLVAAFITGYVVERTKEKSPSKLFLAMTFGNMAFYLFGIPQLSLFIGFKKAILVGLFPFIPGDLLKLALFSKCKKAMALSGRL